MLIAGRWLLTLGLLAAPSVALGQALPPTYYAASQGLVPVAAGATDIFCLNGAAGVVTRIVRLALQGLAGASATVPVTVVKRSTINTGGTLAVGNAAPVAIAASSTLAAATSTPRAWTANPTLGTPVGIMAAVVWAITTTGSSPDNTGSVLAVFGDERHWPITLRAATEALCVNFNSTAITSGNVNVSIRWTEDGS